MSLTFGDFKKAVAGYMNRDVETFNVNGVDLLTRAVNQAKRWAERQHNFEGSRMSTRIETFGVLTGGKLSSMVDNDSPGKSVQVKVIERAFLPFADGSGTFPIEVVGRNRHMERVRKKYEDYVITDPKTLPQTTVNYFQLVQHGDLLYLTPADPAAVGDQEFLTMFFDVVRWLPPYVDDNDSDFLLDFCEDFMIFRAVYQLNFLVKEDVRVQISQKALADSWESVLRWDNNAIAGSNADASLD